MMSGVMLVQMIQIVRSGSAEVFASHDRAGVIGQPIVYTGRVNLP